MLGSYRHAVAALIGCLIFASGGHAQNTQRVAGGSPKVESAANGATAQNESNATEAVSQAGAPKGKNAVQADCGTPKECRAEQRDKDDLIAQQTAADAAVSQRNAAWWQTGIGAAGVILLILTVIYTHLATRAAIDSVSTLVAVERGQLSISNNPNICRTDGIKTTFDVRLGNSGRTTAALREVCAVGSTTGLYADFVPKNIKKFNTVVAPGANEIYHSLQFDTGDPDFAYVVGYYKYTTIFSHKVITDYFCFEVGAPVGPPDEHGRVVGHVPVTYHFDRDWPPDESLN